MSNPAPMLPRHSVGTLASYAGLEQVGEGTYGYVYKAKDQRTGETVALKRLLFHKENLGFPLNAVRELKFLKCLQHKNIVQLKDVVNAKSCERIERETKTDTNRSEDKRLTREQEKHESEILSACGNIYLVFEFVDHDLGGLLDAKYKFSIREVKCIAKQLFEVLEFLSEKKILHRDIKSSNILITNRHQVKLADFGLARSIMAADGRDLRLDLTNNVVTMWYKAPELLLGAVRYAHAIDVWSVGCVIAELELGRPLFPGRTDAEQMDLVCRTLGTPTEDNWTGVQRMPAYDAVLASLTSYSTTLRSNMSGRLSDSLIDLLERILVFDPSRRGSAKILLTNKYFHTQPLPPIEPTDLEPLNVTAGVSYHEYKTKALKRQRENDKTQDLPTAQFSTGSAESVQGPAEPSAPPAAPASTGMATVHQLPPGARPPPPPPPAGVLAPTLPMPYTAPGYGVGIAGGGSSSASASNGAAYGAVQGAYGAPIIPAPAAGAIGAAGGAYGASVTGYGAPIHAGAGNASGAPVGAPGTGRGGQPPGYGHGQFPGGYNVPPPPGPTPTPYGAPIAPPVMPYLAVPSAPAPPAQYTGGSYPQGAHGAYGSYGGYPPMPHAQQQQPQLGHGVPGVPPAQVGMGVYGPGGGANNQGHFQGHQQTQGGRGGGPHGNQQQYRGGGQHYRR